MTTSTNAILFYGYCWKEEQRYPWDEEEDHDDRFARLSSIVPPNSPYPAKEDNSLKAAAIRMEYAAFWDKKSNGLILAGCTVSTHCSNKAPMPYVAIFESRRIATRGYPYPMSQAIHLPAEIGWDEKLKNFCTKMQIVPPEDKPQWWMVSNWS
jgi:hypothetical protein